MHAIQTIELLRPAMDAVEILEMTARLETTARP
jgi:hypothetical protein